MCGLLCLVQTSSSKWGVSSLIVSIEAGNDSTWKKYVGEKGVTVGINRFGESAPYKKVYDHLNLSVEKIVDDIQKILRNN